MKLSIYHVFTFCFYWKPDDKASPFSSFTLNPNAASAEISKVAPELPLEEARNTAADMQIFVKG